MRKFLWKLYTQFYPWFLRKVYHMDIGDNCRIAHSVYLDKSINPCGIHIGDATWLLRESMILAHDNCRNLKADVIIGNNCVIGVRSIIMPGVSIGNQVVVGMGSVVTKDIPDNCMVVGNPVRIIRKDIKIQNGKIIDNGQTVSKVF